MRFIKCPNCLSSHADDYLDRDTVIGQHPLNHRKRSRLHSLTKALFSPARASFGGNKSTKCTCCSSSNPTNEHLDSGCSDYKYRLERKHKVKKRDLIKQNQFRSQTTGNHIL